MEVICYSCGGGEKPENTIEAIQHCQNVNPDWRIEMDLQMSRDGEVVLFHDTDTKTKTGVKHCIADLNLSEIKQLNCGYNFKLKNEYPYRKNAVKIPTLKEVCDFFPNAKLLLDIHTKKREAIDEIVSIIEQRNMQSNIVVVSHYDNVLLRFKKKRPNWKYGAATMETAKMVYSSFLFLDRFFPVRSDILIVPVKFGIMKLLTSRVSNHVSKRNKELWVWLELWIWLKKGKQISTIKSRQELNKLKKKKVDGIFTEYPERLNKELT
ncbi:glycerophosphodiester phosphodiesterase family protein [Aquimarina sediminis]|uniref:glycerophosphodiester phosphodiesterase family protein n=1 Tax=Aquimarina sediminis TaxID=2070536 RepID=UPI000CA00D82|nr:glycerophosphodiester phosphodiesterase family protein [Aquimarina sediminis]